MSTNDNDTLARLLKAREPKGKKAPVAIPMVGHKKKKQPAEEKKTSRARIAHRSDKMKGIMAAIKPLYKKFLEADPTCDIRSPECTGQATEVHHAAGRGITKLMDTDTWKASCTSCNLYVEKHDAWARENGFKVSKHAKNQNNI